MLKDIKSMVVKQIRGPRKLYNAWKTKRKLGAFKDSEEIFTYYYENHVWNGGGEETASGAGSTKDYTVNVRRELPILLHNLGVKSMLDAPCGDFSWFRLIKGLEDVKYLGGDIVNTMVQNNQKEYGDERISFTQIDITNDKLPKVDLWMCRDCLFHLSNSDIFKALHNFLKSDISYLLTSTHPKCMYNADITSGHFRLLNLEIEPFDFGTPSSFIDDWIDGYPTRKLALWSKEEIKKCLSGKVL